MLPGKELVPVGGEENRRRSESVASVDGVPALQRPAHVLGRADFDPEPGRRERLAVPPDQRPAEEKVSAPPTGVGLDRDVSAHGGDLQRRRASGLRCRALGARLVGGPVVGRISNERKDEERENGGYRPEREDHGQRGDAPRLPRRRPAFASPKAVSYTH